MEQVIGIGGIFFRSRDPAMLAAWYSENLGVQLNPAFGGSQFGPTGDTVWAPFPQDTQYFGAGMKAFMINYRVENLERMRAQLKANGVEVLDEVDSSEFGKFGWAIDPEGNKFELWEPPPKT